MLQEVLAEATAFSSPPSSFPEPPFQIPTYIYKPPLSPDESYSD